MKENFNFQDNEYYNINNNNVKENSFSNKQIIIKGIPRETTKKDIINYFKKYGEIENVIIDSNISDSYFNKSKLL
jgi:RNA recognition motif-containing protein